MQLKIKRPLPSPPDNADLLPKDKPTRDRSTKLPGPRREVFEPPKPVASRKLRQDELPPPRGPPSDLTGLPQRALFSVNETVELLSISRPHIYRMVALGDLVAVRVKDRTLFRRDDLVMFLRNLETLPARAKSA